MKAKKTKTADHSRAGVVDYSSVTPATGTGLEDKPIAKSFANQMPTADFPAEDSSPRANPDKTIPGPEAATGLDAAVQERIDQSRKGNKRMGR